MLARISGSLVAAVVGDCIGAHYEGSSVVTVEAVLRKVEMIEKAHNKRKKHKAENGQATAIKQFEYTDDTAMARSIAASLIDKKTLDVKDIAKRFGEEYKKEPGRGYGSNVVTVLEEIAKFQDVFKPAREQFGGTGSYGNGGAMRVAPLGLYCYKSDFLELKGMSREVTTLTHTHPHGILGAILQCRAVQLALTLDNRKPLDPSHFLDTLHGDIQPLEKMDSEKKEQVDSHSKPSFCEKLELIQEFLARDVLQEEVVEKLGNNITALGSVPTAVYCFLKGSQKAVKGIEDRNEVEQTILYAISLGGDTDTIATMAGAIAGAFFGIDMVPEAWQEVCEGVDDAKEFAKGIAKLVAEI